MRVFLDSSVFFAACISSTGASREIIKYAIRGKIELVINHIVLIEVERNLVSKRPEATALLNSIKESIPFKIVDPTEQEVRKMMPHIAVKDAPHLATAKKVQVSYMVSLDRCKF